MPLALPALHAQLEALFSSPPLVRAGNAVDATATRQACAQKWADAVQAYFAGIVPPSTTVSAAAATLVSALTSAFGAAGSAPAAMESAFLAFATTVAGGMAPTYVGVPPVAPVGFASLASEPFPPTHAAAAQEWANLIDTWAKTGTASLAAPPNTPTTWT